MEDLLKFLGSATILIGAIAWLIRSLVMHFLSKDIENYKSELRFQLLDHEHRISRLHEKRAEIISELYKKLFVFLAAAESLANPITFSGEPDKKEKVNKLAETAGTFRQYYNEHKIYFSKSFCKKIDSLWDKVFDATRKYAFWVNREEFEGGINSFEAWEKAWDVISKDSPDLLEQLQHEFRELLGVES